MVAGARRVAYKDRMFPREDHRDFDPCDLPAFRQCVIPWKGVAGKWSFCMQKPFSLDRMGLID
jgi:hypothetical protein